MSEEFSRSALVLGDDSMKKLSSSRVIVFGLGGVGGYVVEALARTGVGHLDLVDNDEVSLSNLNRQIYALHSTVGKDKVDVAADRVLDINPNCVVTKHKIFYLPETADQINLSDYDYIVDCIDTVSAKLELVMRAKEADVPIISSMGTGNKLDPSKLKTFEQKKAFMDEKDFMRMTEQDPEVWKLIFDVMEKANA